MPDDAIYAIRHRHTDEDPTTWLHAQLEYLDQELTNHAQARARHLAVITMCDKPNTALRVRYHQTQAATCTTRIDNLLDLRLRLTNTQAAQ